MCPIKRNGATNIILDHILNFYRKEGLSEVLA
jgi:hypothetical protein